MLVGIAAAVVVAAVTSWVVVGSLSARTLSSGHAAQLVLDTKALSAAVDDLIPLGISTHDGETVDGVVLTGLPPGSNITNGRPLDNGAWHLFVYELATAAIRPPMGFVGAADLDVELQHKRQTVDHRTQHFEWTRAAK